LERLVDGELDDVQRRALLGRLDREPDGWRRCALAFLESQCFAQALGGLGREMHGTAGLPGNAAAARAETEPPAASPAGSVEARRVSRWGWPRLARLNTPLAMAGSFLVALVVGVVLGPLLVGGYGARTLLVTAPEQQTRLATSPTPGVRMPAAPGQRSDPWQMVTLSLPGSGQGGNDAIRVPAIQRDHFDADWVRNLPGALPADVLQALRQSGHEVSQVRDLLPIRLRDGHELIVPVDQIEVRPVSAGAFQ